MKRVIATVAVAVAGMFAAATAQADPNVPYQGGWCDSGDGTNVIMIRYQGSVFTCTPPGFWTKVSGIR
ncbi:hypothetical protein [Mycolicibacillus trivialis]|uniref:hypothetical protein n=1 Tax=Mycolicibacillus trivialis TaxID=1798 RepID=UPI0010549494|nr:hypothetical protein [Mycolicibacillus trivialis]